jgi:hypothetical protein
MVLLTTAGLTMYGKISSSNTDSHQTLQVYSIPERSPHARFHLLARSNAQGRPPIPITLGLRREQFVACTWSVARGHVRKEKDKAEVVGDNKAFEVSDRSTLTSLDELKLLAG